MKRYFYMTTGAFLYALSVNLFLVPSKIVTGGLSGIAAILFHLYSVSAFYTIAVGNILLFIFAWLTLGKKFVFESFYTMLISTLFISLTEALPPIASDTILCAIFGGIILGLGIGLAFISGSTTGGTDILARILQSRHPHFSIGTIMTIIDFVIIAISYLAFGEIELVMYGIISLFVTNAVIDGIIAHLNSGVLVFIISKNSERLKKAIIGSIGRGVTIVQGCGGYSDEKKQILVCVMKKYDLENLKRITDMNEKEAFMIVTEAKSVLGEGFRYYK